MTRRGIALAAILAALPVASSVAEQTPREGAFRTGTGAIAGVISSRDSGRPITRASVRLSGSSIPGLTSFTDDSGRFSFAALPSGQFTLTAAKAQHLAMSYGQEEPGRGSGVPVSLKEGESRTLNWQLPRAGTIHGRVLDLGGQPQRGAVVVLQQRRMTDGEPRFVTCCAQARTDATGSYRLAMLLPGEYFVSAVPPGDYRFIGDASAVYSEEMRHISAQEVQWALAALKGGTSTAPAAAAPEPARGRSVALGRVYFGGVLDPARSTAVVLKLGEERGGIDMTMQLVPTAMISARAVMPDGTPPAAASFVFSDGWSSTGSALPEDGRFERRNLAPGRYRLTVRGRGASVSGSRTIDVDGEDLRDLTITMAPASAVSGRIVFEPGQAGPPDVTQMQVSLSPGNLLTPVRVSAENRWSMPLVDPGRYRVTTNVPPAARNTWSLKSVMAAGRDVTDAGFDIASGEALTDVVVTFTSRRTALSGLLLTEDAQPAAGFYVVVFSDDPAHWVTGSRRVPAPVRASTDGSYQFAGLPPGGYRLAAMTQVDPADLGDPGFLAMLKKSAILVTLAEGETRRQDVKFGK